MTTIAENIEIIEKYKANNDPATRLFLGNQLVNRVNELRQDNIISPEAESILLAIIPLAAENEEHIIKSQQNELRVLSDVQLATMFYELADIIYYRSGNTFPNEVVQMLTSAYERIENYENEEIFVNITGFFANCLHSIANTEDEKTLYASTELAIKANRVAEQLYGVENPYTLNLLESAILKAMQISHSDLLKLFEKYFEYAPKMKAESDKTYVDFHFAYGINLYGKYVQLLTPEELSNPNDLPKLMNVRHVTKNNAGVSLKNYARLRHTYFSDNNNALYQEFTAYKILGKIAVEDVFSGDGTEDIIEFATNSYYQAYKKAIAYYHPNINDSDFTEFVDEFTSFLRKTNQTDMAEEIEGRLRFQRYALENS